MSSCSGGDDGGGGDDGFPSPGAGARAVAQQSALQDAIHSIAQTVGQMQETMMTMIRKMERTDETVRGVERRLTQQGEMVAKMGSRMSELDRSLHEAKGRAAPPHNERGLAFSDGGPSLQNAPRSAVPDGRASSQNELRPGYECPPAFCHAHRSTPSLPHIRDPPTQASSQSGSLDPVPVQPHHNDPREANPKARSSSQSLYRPPPPTQQRMASPDTGHSPPPSIFQLLPSIRCSSSSSGHQSSREARSPSLDVGHEPPQQHKYRHSDCWLGDFILHKDRSKSPSDRCSASPRAHRSSPFDPRSTLPQDRSSLSLQESSLRSQAGYCWGTQSEFRSLSPDTVPHDGRSQTPQEQRTHTSDDNRSPAKSVCGARGRLNSSESSDEDRSSRGKLSVSADGRSKSTEDDLSAERAPSQPGRVCRLEAAHEARFQAPAGSALHLGCCKASDDPLGNRHLPPPPALRRSPPADVHYTPPIVQYKSDSSTSTSYSTDDSSAASDSLGSRCRRRARSSGATSAASTRTRTPGAAARAQGSSCSSTTSRSSASASPSVASRPPPPDPAAAMPKRDSFTSVRSVCTSVAPVRAGAAVLRPRPRPPPTLASAIPPPAPSAPRPRPFAPPRQCASSSPTRAPAPAPAAAHGPASAPAAAPADHEEAARVAALGRYLLAAAHDGKADEVRMLLNAGADVNYSNSLKWTALHKAAAKAHAAVVALLLRRGADAAAATCYGFTPLHIATYNDRSGQCVVRLIAAGAGLERANRSGRTPLHTAVESGNVAAMLALLAAGADRHHKDEEGKTPMDVAKTFCVKRLLRSTERRERKPKAKRCRTQPSVSAADAPTPAPGLAPAHGYVSE